MIGLYKAELVHRRGPWRGCDDLGQAGSLFAGIAWVYWGAKQASREISVDNVAIRFKRKFRKGGCSAIPSSQVGVVAPTNFAIQKMRKHYDHKGVKMGREGIGHDADYALDLHSQVGFLPHLPQGRRQVVFAKFHETTR